jgi:diguanylate cyclase (GGDEF)-like protein
MSTLETPIRDIDVRAGRTALADRAGLGIGPILTAISRLRASDYQQIGASLRFRASQRRRTRSAAKVSMLVIAGAVTFDAIALISLDFEKTWPAIAMDIAVLALSLLGWWSVSGILRHHPELVAGAAATGLAFSTVSTGTIVPALSNQTIGYLVLVPGLVALLIPWRTRTHLIWLLSYGLIGFGYLAFGNLDRTPAARSDLILVLVVALGASLSGHVMLQRAQITNFAQLRRIGQLRRKSARDMVELERLHQALELTAQTDPLTGIGNRRRLGEDLLVVRKSIDRLGFSYGIAELDLDHFKSINDRYGHAAGDDVLLRVAKAIQASLRAQDAIYRLGGEEFLVLFQLANVEGLTAAAERLRAVVFDLAIDNIDNAPSGRATVSLGATFIDSSDLDQTDDQWIARADAGLYEAKGAGRDRVCVHGR